ncbi:MAG: prephenate dehydrogenase [Actinomycetales bacterium]
MTRLKESFDFDKQVLIVGTGLIGASIALALRRAGVDVLLDDVDSEQIDVAVARGAGRRLEAADTPEVVVVAVPPQEAADTLVRVSTAYPKATLTDVTSVKAPILQAAIASGADPARLVGGHPMAGREVSGAAGAREDLLDDRLWIITPQRDTASLHKEVTEHLIVACGAVPVVMSADDHDRAVALVSHAPQVLSSALAGLLLDAPASHVQIAGQGLRDMTRIAGSSPTLWTEILSTNAEPVTAVLTHLVERLQLVVNALSTAPSETANQGLEASLADGVLGRERIPGRHGSKPQGEAIATVMIADRPGELARLFTAAGVAGINLEDVRIEHVLGRPSGLVELIVAPSDLTVLVSTLQIAGFDVRL